MMQLSCFMRLKSDARPNEVTVLSIFSAIAQLGCVTSGRWVRSFIHNKHNCIALNAKVGNALIYIYYKCGSSEDACLVFDVEERHSFLEFSYCWICNA
jgi:hypothetical protein